MSDQSLRLALSHIADVASLATSAQPPRGAPTRGTDPVRLLQRVCEGATDPLALMQHLCDGTTDEDMHVVVPVRALRSVIAAARTPQWQAVRSLIANDAYAVTFQTFGQYRTALLKTIDALAAAHAQEGEHG